MLTLFNLFADLLPKVKLMWLHLAKFVYVIVDVGFFLEVVAALLELTAAPAKTPALSYLTAGTEYA